VTTIFSGWQEQYERMLRSHKRLTDYASGQRHFSPDEDGSAEARDALIHFFQDAYHLKDWLKNDKAIGRKRARQQIKKEVEGYVSDTLYLKICADVANGSKHLQLDPERPPSRTGDPNTGITGQSVTVRAAAVGSGGEPEPAIHSWEIESNGVPYDALDTASKIVEAWDAWLGEHRLLQHMDRPPTDHNVGAPSVGPRFSERT